MKQGARRAGAKPRGVADVEKKPEYAFGEFGGRYIPETLMEAHEVGAYTHRCIMHTSLRRLWRPTRCALFIFFFPFYS